MVRVGDWDSVILELIVLFSVCQPRCIGRYIISLVIVMVILVGGLCVVCRVYVDLYGLVVT